MLKTLRSTLRGTIIYSIGNLSSKLVGLILIPLYTSKLTLAEFGILGIIEITSQLLIAILGLSLYNAFFRWYWDKDYKDKQQSIFFTILVFIGFISFSVAGVLILFSSTISTFLFEVNDYSYILRLVFLISAMEAIGVIILTLMRVKENAVLYTTMSLIKLVVNLTLTVYFIVGLGKRIDGIFEAQIIGSMVFLLLTSGFVIKNIKLNFDFKALKGMLSFSIPLIFSGVIGIILTITDRYSLRFLSDMESVGIYTLGFKVANTLKVFVLSSISLALQPIIFKMMDQPDNKRFYSKIMTYLSFGVMILVLAFSMFGREVIVLLARNQDYLNAWEVIPVLSLSIFFVMLRDTSMTGVNLMKKTKVIAFVIFVVALLNIGLNILLIPKFDYMGAAIATMISQIFFFIMIYIFAQKFYKINYEIKKVLLIIVIAIILYALSLAFNNWSLIFRILAKSGLILSFPFILYLFRFYEPIELETTRRLWIKWKNPRKWRDNLQKQ